MKRVGPVVAGLLWVSTGCGYKPPSRPAATEEPRHPSNAMNPLPKAETAPEKPPSAKHTAAKPARRTPAFEDPRRIPTGIDYSAMVRRFGPPSMKVTDSPMRTIFTYSKLKTQVQVEVQNGKVVSVASINTGF